MTTATTDRVTPLLKGALPPALFVGAAAIAVAAWAAGSRGAYGAVLGVLIVVVFSGTGLLAMRLVRTEDAMLATIVGMGSYVLRIVLFGIALAVTGAIDVDQWLDRTATAVAMVATVLAWVVGEIRAFNRLRVPVFDVELPATPEDAEAAVPGESTVDSSRESAGEGR